MDINIPNPVTKEKIGSVINAAASATPNDTDLVISVEASVAKKNTWTQIKSFLKTYFDTIYQAAGSYLTSANITQVITNGVTDKAPSEDAVFDALALKQNIVAGVDDTEIGYLNGVTSAIQTQLNTKVVTVDLFNVNNLSVVDLVQYFIGQSTTAGTTVNQIPLIPVQAGTVVAVTAEVFSASTIGSNENGTLTLWYNNGAASVVISSAFKVDANRHAFTEYTGLSTAINAGNIYMTYDAPNLTTNPTGIQFRFNVYIRP